MPIPFKSLVAASAVVLSVFSIEPRSAEAQFPSLTALAKAGEALLEGDIEKAAEIVIDDTTKVHKTLIDVLNGNIDLDDVPPSVIVESLTGVPSADLEVARDLALEGFVGEAPDDILRELNNMVAHCRTDALTALQDPKRYQQAEKRFTRNGQHFEDARVITQPLAQYLGPEAIATVAVLELTYWGMADKMEEIRTAYEEAVKICEDAYNNAMAEQITEIDNDRDLLELKFESIESQIAEIHVKTLDALTDARRLAKSRIEDRFGTTIPDEHLNQLMNEHRDLVGEILMEVQRRRTRAIISIGCLAKISNSEDLVRSFDGSNAATLCEEAM